MNHVRRVAVGMAVLAIAFVLVTLFSGIPSLLAAPPVVAATLIIPGYGVLCWTQLPASWRMALVPPLSISLGLLGAWVSVLSGNGDNVHVQQAIMVTAAISALIAAWKAPSAPKILDAANEES